MIKKLRLFLCFNCGGLFAGRLHVQVAVNLMMVEFQHSFQASYYENYGTLGFANPMRDIERIMREGDRGKDISIWNLKYFELNYD